MSSKWPIEGLKLTENELKTIVAGVRQWNGKPDFDVLKGALGMATKEGAEKRWSRLRKDNFGMDKSKAGSGKSLALLESCVH
jgi:hypothetical protein